MFFVFVLIMGVITGMIARSKGRSFLGWFIYGTLLFIVAIVHVILIKPPATKHISIDKITPKSTTLSKKRIVVTVMALAVVLAIYSYYNPQQTEQKYGFVPPPKSPEHNEEKQESTRPKRVYSDLPATVYCHNIPFHIESSSNHVRVSYNGKTYPASYKKENEVITVKWPRSENQVAFISLNMKDKNRVPRYGIIGLDKTAMELEMVEECY